MIVAIASGKGGTGKTTVSASLDCRLTTISRLPDCDPSPSRHPSARTDQFGHIRVSDPRR